MKRFLRSPAIPIYKSVPFLTLSFSLLVLFSGTSHAQKFFTAEKSYALKLGRTRPLYEVVPVGPTDSLKLKERKLNKPKFVPNFAGRRHLDFHLESALPQGADPLFKAIQERVTPVEILPKVVFEGINEANANSGVPDVNGDIGRDYYVEVVNSTHFRVFDKTGQPVSNLIAANSIWSQVQQSSAGDPILLYDQEADRWFLTEFPSNNRVLLAISVTNDPRGSWDAYAFQTPRFPDFPKYGIWPDAFYLTTNESGPNFPIYAFNRADLLAGKDIVQFQRLTVPKHGGVFFEVGQPVDWDGMERPPAGSPGLVVKMNDDDWGTTNQDHIILHKIHIDWDSSAKSNIELIEIPSAPFDSDGCSFEHTGGFSCVPQPNGQGIDGAEWIITNKAQYRNFGSHESFVMSFMVDVTGEEVAGIRWMEFRKTPTQDWHIYQEGTVGSDDGLHRFMSSIGIDGQGNIGLAYSISGESKHPSLRYTGRYASDPLGEMTFQEYEFATGSGSLGFDRYGDYASMSVDPSDDQTFWFAGEYVPTNGSWSTKIVAFSASRDTFDIFPLSLIAPQNSPDLAENETLSINVLNRGLNTVYDFKMAYQFMDGQWIEEDAAVDSLEIDSIYTHTFQTGLNFDGPGNFPLRVATNLDLDRNRRNDTLSFVIIKQAYRDAALEFDATGQGNIVCSDARENSVIIRNMGADTIFTAAFELFKNSLLLDTLQWNGELLPAQEDILTVEIAGLQEGDNEIAINLIELNGDNDEIPSNNNITWTLTAKPSGEEVILHLTTDNFPQETTWELVDSANQVILTDGPFSDQQNLYTIPFCLDPDACYTFIIYDAFGDGMSAQGVTGDYEIVNEDGVVIASLSKPNFGLVDANEFCLSGECLLDVELAVVNESAPGAGDAWVMAEVSNSLGQLLFSMNGGAFQQNNTFLNLSAGEYTLIVKDDAGCSDTVFFSVHACNIETFISTVPASGGDVGEIHITAMGGVGPLTYSLNGSQFITDTFFTMLEPGDYIVFTRDSIGCEKADTVTVSTSVSTKHISNSHFIKVFPNPGKGLFQVDAILNSDKVFIDYRIYNAAGEPLVEGALARYDQKYKGEISVIKYPPGIYYAAFYIGDGIVVKPLIKTE